MLSSLAGQSNLLVKIQVWERDFISTERRTVSEESHLGLSSGLPCTRTQEHVHTHNHTQNKQAKRKRKQPDAEKAWRQVGAFTEQAYVLPKE